LSTSEQLKNNIFLDWIYFYYTYIGSIVVSVFCFKLFLSRVRGGNDYAAGWVPFQTILFWTFIFIPFGAILPSYFIQENGNPEEIARF